MRCDDCRHERLVAFSCKSRALCPSCTARRIVWQIKRFVCDSGAHVVEGETTRHEWLTIAAPGKKKSRP